MNQKPDNKTIDLTSPDSPHFNSAATASDVKAWEEVEKGRFLPRRIRGSCTGRALG